MGIVWCIVVASNEDGANSGTYVSFGSICGDASLYLSVVKYGVLGDGWALRLDVFAI